ncbi:MAG: hypothetical protein IPN87_06440 [Saprospiraceae bacterium]|nr:hypothetical protein [Candidatus Brachybacter algidus]HQW71350.1 hypothetical protein [Saprospiraceae bacterium]
MKNLFFLIIFCISIISCDDKSFKDSAGPHAVNYKRNTLKSSEDILSCNTTIKDRNCAQGVNAKSNGGCSTDISLCNKIVGFKDFVKQQKNPKKSSKSCGCSSSPNVVVEIFKWNPTNSSITKNASASL